jgi:hypothetical protein
VGGCGYGSNLASQASAAVACVFSNADCPHNQYQVGRPVEALLKEGAQFVVNQLVG